MVVGGGGGRVWGIADIRKSGQSEKNVDFATCTDSKEYIRNFSFLLARLLQSAMRMLPGHSQYIHSIKFNAMLLSTLSSHAG